MSEDNLDQGTDNQDPKPEVNETAWFDGLGSDIKNSPSIQKFKSGEELAKGYLELQSAFGKDKVVLPQGDNPDGWGEFYSKIGVPEDASGYKLPDVEMPEGMEIDKGQFAQLAKEVNLTPNQASQLFEKYTAMGIAGDKMMQEAQEKQLGEMSKLLRGEWGAAYDTKIDLGNRVIEANARDEQSAEWLKTQLGNDPRGVAFLADLGSQFSENSIGSFKAQSFTMTPVEAQSKIDDIMLTQGKENQHSYFSDDPSIRKRGIEEMESLFKMANAKR